MQFNNRLMEQAEYSFDNCIFTDTWDETYIIFINSRKIDKRSK